MASPKETSCEPENLAQHDTKGYKPPALSSPKKKRALAPKNALVPASKKQKTTSYTYETVDGWIHCRVPVKMSPLYNFGLAKNEDVSPLKRPPSAPGELFKDQRYPCPSCEKWYRGDKNHVQRSCRHRERYETAEELARWDIGFPEDY